MKKILVVGLAVLLSAGVAFAGESGSACIGSGCGNVNGSFKIDTLAIGGGIDAAGKIGNGGAAGGISGAGGVTVGQASGEITTFSYKTYGYNGGTPGDPGYYKKLNGNTAGTIKYFPNGQPENNSEWTFMGSNKGWYTKTIAGGTASAELVTRGGGLTKTEAYKINENGFVGVGSASDSIAVTEARLQLSSFGIAAAEGCFFGVAGEGSANGSIMFNHGVTVGVAGQYGAGYIAGGALTALVGKADIDAGIDINGQSYSESYKGTFVNGQSTTQVLGSNVGAFTEVNSWGSQEYCGLSGGFLSGGWQAGGLAAAHTVQVVNGGVASASAVGSYSGSGPLGCNFEGSAVGGTQTSATTVSGYNGAIMTSSASMKVTAKNISAPQN